MNRRLFRPLAYVLIAAQLLLSAPVVTALPASATSASEMPCADSMPPAEHEDSCPCCPDGTSGNAACLSVCTGIAAPTPAQFAFVGLDANVPPPSLSEISRTQLADPPLNPPPIQ